MFSIPVLVVLVGHILSYVSLCFCSPLSLGYTTITLFVGAIISTMHNTNKCERM